MMATILNLIGSYCQYNGIGSFMMPSILSFGAYIFVFIVALWYLRKSQGGFLSFSIALITTLIITVVSTLISTGVVYAYGSTFSDEKKNEILDRIVEEALYDDYFSDKDELKREDQLRTQYQMLFKMNAAGLLSLVAGMLFIGVIGLIVSLVMKLDSPDGRSQMLE